MILAAHQVNFIPWLPWWDKVNKADIFVLMTHCQYEKNGWQNRCQVDGKYWTKPVVKGNLPINEKVYADGQGVVATNIAWIIAIARTLGIDTKKFQMDFPTELIGTKRIAEYCHKFKCSFYLTNPDSRRKYLDTEMLGELGIKIVDHNFPHRIHLFEAFKQWGIEGTVKLLNKEKKRWITSLNSSST